MGLQEQSPLVQRDLVKQPDSSISTGEKQVVLLLFVILLSNIMQLCHILNLQHSALIDAVLQTEFLPVVLSRISESFLLSL
jgi:hypothetical protein